MTGAFIGLIGLGAEGWDVSPTQAARVRLGNCHGLLQRNVRDQIRDWLQPTQGKVSWSYLLLLDRPPERK